MTELLSTGDPGARLHVLLAHGAGAPMTSPFMSQISELLAGAGLRVTRFEFAYMAARRDTGKRRPPPKAERLIEEYLVAVERVHAGLGADQRLIIGGKSMGGRVASMAADGLHGRSRAAGLVCLGYPFHPPAKPEQLRAAHLAAMTCPALIVQGERDPFGSRGEVEAMAAAGAFADTVAFWWATDGDHDLGPRGGSGTTRAANLQGAAAAVAAFARRVAD